MSFLVAHINERTYRSVFSLQRDCDTFQEMEINFVAVVLVDSWANGQVGIDVTFGAKRFELASDADKHAFPRK